MAFKFIFFLKKGEIKLEIVTNIADEIRKMH